MVRARRMSTGTTYAAIFSQSSVFHHTIRHGPMDSLNVCVGGAIATIATVLITHWMNQRGGTRRLTEVRDELYLRLNAIDVRLNEFDQELNKGLRGLDRRDDSVERR